MNQQCMVLQLIFFLELVEPRGPWAVNFVARDDTFLPQRHSNLNKFSLWLLVSLVKAQSENGVKHQLGPNGPDMEVLDDQQLELQQNGKSCKALVLFFYGSFSRVAEYFHLSSSILFGRTGGSRFLSSLVFLSSLSDPFVDQSRLSLEILCTSIKSWWFNINVQFPGLGFLLLCGFVIILRDRR